MVHSSERRTIRLNLGAGSSPIAGYLSVDTDPSARPVIAAEIARLPIQAATVDEIIAYHVIEHVNYWEAEAALAEWYRVLRPGGSIAIECPNIERVVRSLGKSADYTKWSQMGMWGVYGDPNHRNPFYSHKWGYTPLTLTGMLVRAGFTDVKSVRPLTHVPARDLRLEARKPANAPHPLWAGPRETVQRARIFWFLIGGPDIASSRIHGYHIHHYLRAQGWETHILLEPNAGDWISDIPLPLSTVLQQRLFRAGDIAVFQKVSGMNTAALIEHLTGLGVKTVFIDCDMPLKLPEASVALWTICTSKYLTRQYLSSGTRHVVYLPDPAEDLPVSSGASPEKSQIRCIWFGNWSPERAQGVAQIRAILSESEFSDFEFRVISNVPQADVQWSLETIGGELAGADLAVLPVSVAGDAEKAKSANRAIQAMASGLPVVASDIPAYREVIERGWNGYLCSSPDDWRTAFRELRDPQARGQMAQNARTYAAETASLEVVGPLWETFFRNLSADSEHRPSGIVTRFKSHKMRALLYGGIALRGPSRSRRLFYLVHAWLMWPFSVELWKMTARFGIDAARFLRRRVAPTS
ncbi:MAG: glycosyltransferase [Anaerolineae bacterium]